MVRGAGIEPARPFGHSILSAAWLPITTPAREYMLGGADRIRTGLERFCRPLRNQSATAPHLKSYYSLRYDN
jgi:hypothetical protein